MQINSFLVQLVIISIVTWLILLGLTSVASLSVEPLFYSISIACFFIFNVLLFFFAIDTSKSRNLFSFNNTVILSLILKLVMAMSILMIYERVVGKVSTFHAVFFLLIYIIYTAFEVHYLMKLARSKAEADSTMVESNKK